MPMPRTSSRGAPDLARAASSKRSWTHASTDLGAARDVDVEGALGERRAGEVADRQPRVGGAEVGDQHDARARLKASTVGGRPPVEALPPAS